MFVASQELLRTIFSAGEEGKTAKSIDERDDSTVAYISRDEEISKRSFDGYDEKREKKNKEAIVQNV